MESPSQTGFSGKLAINAGDRPLFFHSSPLPVAKALLLCSLLSASAVEYFVSPTGNDTNDGRSRDAAFATIQKGATTMAAGDILTIAPGEYRENVMREGLGDSLKETLIRAEIPGTALLRGDVPAPEFTKDARFRFVYSAPFDGEPLAVTEHDTLRVLERKPDLGEVEFEPGTCYYDKEKKMLYISPSDLRSPAGRKYTVNVKTGHGVFLTKPRNVVIDGLAVTGYTAPGTGWHFITGRTWGIALLEPSNCTVRRCTTFLNFGGIAMNNSSGNLVDGCLAFANRTYNILVFGGSENHDNIIENSYAFRAESGMHFYGKLAGKVTLRNNRAWGHELDFSNKSGNDDSKKYGIVERCIGLNGFQAHGLTHTIMGGTNEYDRNYEGPADNILFLREKDLDVNREFADPDTMDFRLQADSRFRGKDGQPDRGPYPYKENIYYLSPAGSDQNDGLTSSRAWKDLPSALKKLKSGDTLYLSEGEYEAGESSTLGSPQGEAIRLLGRGFGRVIIKGPLTFENCSGVEWERLTFTGPVSVNGGSQLNFKNCKFGGREGGLSARSVKGLTVSHCFFADNSLRLAGGSGTEITGNMFANGNRPAFILEGEDPITRSEYNGYGNPEAVSKKGNLIQTLAQVQAAGRDLFSLERKVEFDLESGTPIVRNPVVLDGWGPLSGALGVYSEFIKPVPTMAGPFVHSVDDTTANLEWWTSEPMAVELSWGETPETIQTVTIPKSFQYSGYSLTGLKKGQKYQVSIRPAETFTMAKAPETVFFETARTSLERTAYYVAADGDDARDGLSLEKAFRTVGKAAAAVGAGGTILIAAGDYPERVWIRATGTKDQPISVRSLPGQKVSVKSFSMSGKNHIHLDGFYTKEPIQLLLGDDIAVTRCFATGTILSALRCSRLLVKNCVVENGFFSAIQVHNSPEFSMENCVVLRPAINGAEINNEPAQKARLTRNIFTDSIPFKSKIPYFTIGRAESLVEKDNCFYMRTPDPEKGIAVRFMFVFYGDEAYDRTLDLYGLRPASEQPSRFTELTQMGYEEFEKIFGPSGSIFANPEFQGAREMHLEPGQRVKTADPGDMNNGYLLLFSDKLLGKEGLDFPDLFATNPEVVKKGIGLIPSDFKDFHFNGKPTP